jgi:hypothetical protein
LNENIRIATFSKIFVDKIANKDGVTKKGSHKWERASRGQGGIPARLITGGRAGNPRHMDFQIDPVLNFYRNRKEFFTFTIIS